LRGGWRDALAHFHKRNPLLPGMPKEQLRGAVPPQVFENLLREQREIVTTGELARLASHNVALKQDETEALAKIEAAFERAGLRVPSVSEVLAGSGVDPARGRSLLQILLRDKRLARITEDLVFHQTALAALRDVMAQRKGQRFGVAEFKEWTGISRKYAIPLLEMLDRERVTRRDGDSRVVL
jgi:selenocysteine-specific elongation factor